MTDKINDKLDRMPAFTPDWSAEPHQFVHQVDAKRLNKMIRNCEVCRVFVANLGCSVVVQKGSIQQIVSSQDFDESQFHVLFNGLDLTIGGLVDLEGLPLDETPIPVQ